MKRLVCKIVYSPARSGQYIEIIGEVDKTQLLSAEHEWVAVDHKRYLHNGHDSYSHKTFIDKKEIIDILVYKKQKRFVLNKDTLTWNTHVPAFLKINT
jgi:hypothetical protein